MKLVAMLAYYDEGYDLLSKRVDDFTQLGVDHIVAVDGAYDLYPHQERNKHNPLSECTALYDFVHLERGGLTLHYPSGPWIGNEVEKRQKMFDLALSVTTEDDYLLWWDADWVLESPPVDLKESIASERWTVLRDNKWGDVMLTDCPQDDVGWYRIRAVHKARRGLHLVNNHYTIYDADGESTRLHPQDNESCAIQLPVKIRHRPDDRIAGRRDRQRLYYERRHELGIETP